MVQASRPQPDNIANFPAPSDPGPYSSDQWAELFAVLFTGDRKTHQGPFRRYLNELAVTTGAATPVLVETGAGIVNGHVLFSSEQESFVIPIAPATTRQDRVVICENNTNAPVSAPAAAPANTFLWPTDMTEYETVPASAIPAYSARLVIVQGADGGALPGIDQDAANLYMTELWRYIIDNAGVITSNTDYRNFAKTTAASKHRIGEVEVAAGATAASMSFANIPGIFRHLQIECYLRSDQVLNQEQVLIQFNGDGGGNYDYTYLHGIGNNTRLSGFGAAATSIEVGEMCANNAAANYYDQIIIDIPHYANAVRYKNLNAMGATIANQVAANAKTTHRVGWWRNTAAITTILLFPQAGNFQQYSLATLYGID